MGRVYLPQNWIRHAGIDSRSLLDVTNEKRLHQVVTRLVIRAEEFYTSADEGLLSLPLRAALAVAGARWIYSEIGRRVMTKGPIALRERTTVSFPSKIRLLLKGTLSVLSQIPKRLHKPFRKVEIDKVWRLS
jgi:phytoene synthase